MDEERKRKRGELNLFSFLLISRVLYRSVLSLVTLARTTLPYLVSSYRADCCAIVWFYFRSTLATSA